MSNKKTDFSKHRPMPCSNVAEDGYPKENMAHWNGERFITDAELESMPNHIPRSLTRREILELKAFFEKALTS